MLRMFMLIAALAGAGAAPAAAAPTPPIKHVFVLVMENHDYAESFGPDSKAPYLAKTLTGRGELLTQYHGIAHLSLPNYIAMVSGQGPNPQTQSDCQVFSDFAPGTIGADGQALGSGCVYPAPVKTVADQLTAKGLTWGGYMEDMGNTPGEAQNCRHPDLNQQDHTQSAEATDQYAARHNPFVYFHSIIDSPDCAARDVPLSRLPATLAADDVPNYVFITPDLCSDGHDAPCPDGTPGGLEGINSFLQEWIPRIERSRAYRDGGLIVVTFDESESGAESCCVDDAPNTPNAGGPDAGARRRADRRRAALALHRAGHHQRHALQPLLAAAQRRGPLRPRAAGLRRALDRLRRRRLQRADVLRPPVAAAQPHDAEGAAEGHAAGERAAPGPPADDRHRAFRPARRPREAAPRQPPGAAPEGDGVLDRPGTAAAEGRPLGDRRRAGRQAQRAPAPARPLGPWRRSPGGGGNRRYTF